MNLDRTVVKEAVCSRSHCLQHRLPNTPDDKVEIFCPQRYYHIDNIKDNDNRKEYGNLHNTNMQKYTDLNNQIFQKLYFHNLIDNMTLEKHFI